MKSMFIVLGGIPIVVFFAGVTPFHRGFFCNDETIAHPYKDNTITTPVLIVVSLGLPMLSVSKEPQVCHVPNDQLVVTF